MERFQMFGKAASKRLRFESLENRQLLSVNAGSCEVPPPPPPANLDAQVITTYSTNHVRIRDESGGVFVNIERRNTPQNGDAVPFLTGDFNGDGVTDLLGVDQADDWWLHLNDGSRLFEIPVGRGLGEAEPLQTADFNGDGRLDIVSYHPDGELWVSSNQPDGFEHQRWGEFWNPNDWSEFHVGDFNGDGRPDVLGGEVGGHWWLAQNHEGTDFNNYRWGNYPNFDWLQTLSGDFTGDAIDDVVALAPDHTWWLWEGSPTGFQNARFFGHWKMRSEFFNVDVGDMNGDQVDDVVGRSSDGRLWVGTATSTGFNTWSWATGWIDQANWSTTILDINGDGMDDQVGYADDDTWWYALSNGNTFRNSFWQKGGPGDFVAQGFKPERTVDLIDSLPVGGFDTRELVFEASLNSDNQLVLSANRSVGITEVQISSLQNSLILPVDQSPSPFASIQHSSTNYVHYANPQNSPIVLDQPLTLDVGWEPGTSVSVAAQIEGTAHLIYPARVVTNVSASEVEQVDHSALNHNYFDSIPLSAFVHSNQGFSSSGVEPLRPIAEGYLAVVDGHLALHGDFAQLAGLEVTSAGGHLSLETIEIPPLGDVPLANPFSPADGVILSNEPNSVVVGVLGARKRVNLSGTTITSILYDGPVDQVANDLTVRIGLGDDAPTSLRVGEEGAVSQVEESSSGSSVSEGEETGSLPAANVGDSDVQEFGSGSGEAVSVETATEDFASSDPEVQDLDQQVTNDQGYLSDAHVRIADGRLVFEGQVEQLSGLQAISEGGYLRLEEFMIGEQVLYRHEPFAASSLILSNEPTEIVIGVLGEDKRVDLAGETKTAILYGASEDLATGGDLKVFVGQGDDSTPIAVWVGDPSNQTE